MVELPESVRNMATAPGPESKPAEGTPSAPGAPSDRRPSGPSRPGGRPAGPGGRGGPAGRGGPRGGRPGGRPGGPGGRGGPRGGGRPRRRRRLFGGGKVCQCCVHKVKYVDYKDIDILRRFTTNVAKILPRRLSGACSKHQRMLTTAIKRARNIALLPFHSSR